VNTVSMTSAECLPSFPALPQLMGTHFVQYCIYLLDVGRSLLLYVYNSAHGPETTYFGGSREGFADRPGRTGCRRRSSAATWPATRRTRMAAYRLWFKPCTFGHAQSAEQRADDALQHITNPRWFVMCCSGMAGVRVCSA